MEFPCSKRLQTAHEPHVCCFGSLITEGVWSLLCGAQWGRDQLSHGRRIEVHMEVLRDLHTLVSIKEGKSQKEWLDLGGEKRPSSNLEICIAQSANSLSTFTAYPPIPPFISTINPPIEYACIDLPTSCIHMYLYIYYISCLSIHVSIYPSTKSTQLSYSFAYPHNIYSSDTWQNTSKHVVWHYMYDC